MRAAIRQILFSQTPFHPRRLFSSGEQGGVYIARDLNTLISTAAGSTPDVALNGYAGKWLDQSGLGNHAVQSTSTARPQLSARYNLLTSTEKLGSAPWIKYVAATGVSAVVTQDYAADPLGGMTADSVTYSRAASTTGHRTTLRQVAAGGKASTSYTISIYACRNAATDQRFRLYGNWGTTGASLEVVATNQWGRYSATHSTAAGTSLAADIGLFDQPPSDLSADVLLWGVDLRLTADNALPYQRVTSATDYDSAGFPQFLAFDADDALVATYPSSLGTNCTVCVGRANAAPLILTGQTIDTSYTLNAAVADRVTGLIVVNRALTALETAQVTGYLQARS